jgi:4a-hydroxytetrahydrobiopterin dehydratase
MKSDLADDVIRPPKDGEAMPLKGADLRSLLDRLGNGWLVVDEKYLQKTYHFSDFQQALNFTNKVGELAEKANHHPEICLTWAKVKITISTHSIGGLSKADFVFAAKTDRLAASMR